MRITIDAAGNNAACWVAALRQESRGEEIAVFESGKLGSLLGARGLDFALRGTDVFHASPATPWAPRRAKLTATVEDLSCWLMPLHVPAQVKAARAFAEKILARALG